MTILIAIVAVTGCDDTCKDSSAAGLYWSVSQCPDKVDRKVECVSKSADGKPPFECTCTEGGNVGKKFERTEGFMSAKSTLDAVNRGCGWSVKLKD